MIYTFGNDLSIHCRKLILKIGKLMTRKFSSIRNFVSPHQQIMMEMKFVVLLLVCGAVAVFAKPASDGKKKIDPRYRTS